LDDAIDTDGLALFDHFIQGWVIDAGVGDDLEMGM
jgi:hypothetical protein